MRVITRTTKNGITSKKGPHTVPVSFLADMREIITDVEEIRIIDSSVYRLEFIVNRSGEWSHTVMEVLTELEPGTLTGKRIQFRGYQFDVFEYIPKYGGYSVKDMKGDKGFLNFTDIELVHEVTIVGE